MDFILNLILFIVALAVLIVIHEFGHFITAKLFKVYVNEFSIGFGPLLFKHKKEGAETQFSIRAVPLGGYCSMIGESLPEFTEEEYNALSDKDKELVNLYKTVPANRRLDGIARYKRAIIMVAGVTLNFILAFFLFLGSAATMQYQYVSNVVTVSENSIAANAGWDSDDVIIKGSYQKFYFDAETNQVVEVKKEASMEENTSNLYNLLVDATSTQPTKAEDIINFTLITNEDKTINFSVPAMTHENASTYAWSPIGIQFSTYMVDANLSVGEVFSTAFEMTGEGAIAIFKGIGMMFTPEGFAQTGGLISIFNMSSQATSIGAFYFFYLWGLISVNLAILNLLPFPGLDGWHLLVLIVEGVSRRELPKKFKNTMAMIGMILLFALFIVITFKDIFALF